MYQNNFVERIEVYNLRQRQDNVVASLVQMPASTISKIVIQKYCAFRSLRRSLSLCKTARSSITIAYIIFHIFSLQGEYSRKRIAKHSFQKQNISGIECKFRGDDGRLASRSINQLHKNKNATGQYIFYESFVGALFSFL